MSLKVLSFASISSLFTLMFIGGYVSASGIGLSCPKWPFCPAGIIPKQEFVIEYIHRTFALTTTILVIVTMIFTLKSRKTVAYGMQISCMLATAAAIGQIMLGGIVIVQKLHAMLVTVHLGLGLLLFSMTLMTLLYSYRVLGQPLHSNQRSLRNPIVSGKIDSKSEATNNRVPRDSKKTVR